MTRSAPRSGDARERSFAALAGLTTLQVGGSAPIEWLGAAADIEGIVSAVGAGTLPVALGGGSNVLVADGTLRTPIVLVRTSGVVYRRTAGRDEVLVEVQAGHNWTDLLGELTGEGLVGMETMAGIPGTVGAMPVQNVGAYGQETADTLVQVTAWDWQARQTVTFDAAGCRLGHRTSRFKRNKRWLILTVTFRLRRSTLGAAITYGQVASELGVPKGTQVPVPDLIAAVLQVRDRKGMVLETAGVDGRTVGSVFLSPSIDAVKAAQLAGQGAPVNSFPDGSVRVSASWLIRRSGYSLGEQLARGVRISTRHYTLVADQGATTAAFVDATRDMQQRVLKETGVLMTPEPDPIGELAEYRRLIHRAGGQEA